MKKLSKLENEDILIQEYKSGELVTNISKKYSVPRHRIYSILKQYNIEIKNHRIKDLSGISFGNLTAINIINDDYNKRTKWKCVCKCGATTIVVAHDLISGHTKSCGCALFSKNPLEASIRKVFSAEYSDGDLSYNDFFFYSQQNCFYCGCTPANLHKYAWEGRPNHHGSNGDFVYNGLDRVNNTLPHDKNNVVTCCCQCNAAKSDMNYHDFINHIIKIYENLLKCNFNVIPIEAFNHNTDIYNILYSGNNRTNNKYTPQGSSISKIYRIYFNADIHKNQIMDISLEQFFTISQMNCYYCNSVPSNQTNMNNSNCNNERKEKSYIKYSGLDRVNSLYGHTFGNIVASCIVCNRMKNNYTCNEFIKWIQNIFNTPSINIMKGNVS